MTGDLLRLPLTVPPDGKTVACVVDKNGDATAVVPGDVFEAPYALRFSYACATDQIESGMGRVTEFFQRLQA